MNYCTQQDLVTRFGEAEIRQLSDHGGTGEINTEVVAQAIADATAEIDGYLAGRYALPLANIPELLRLYACDIARYRLFEDGAYEQVVDRYNNALRFLRDVAAGRMQLFSSSEGARPINEAIMLNLPGKFGGGF